MRFLCSQNFIIRIFIPSIECIESGIAGSGTGWMFCEKCTREQSRQHTSAPSHAPIEWVSSNFLSLANCQKIIKKIIPCFQTTIFWNYIHRGIDQETIASIGSGQKDIPNRESINKTDSPKFLRIFILLSIPVFFVGFLFFV